MTCVEVNVTHVVLNMTCVEVNVTHVMLNMTCVVVNVTCQGECDLFDLC